MIAVMLSSVSCLDKEPLMAVTPDSYWQSEDDVERWMIGMYDALQTTMAANMYLWGEARSDNAEQAASGSTATPYLTNSLVSSLSSSSWTSLYRTISLANSAIKYIPTVEGISDEAYNKYLAEAYTMRALMYFQAIRIWGDLPLITEPYEGLEGQTMYYSRSNVVDVMALIRNDIDMAIELFDSSTQVYRLTAGAAYALKADVHMWCAGTDDWFADSTVADRTAFPVTHEGIKAEYESVVAAAQMLDDLGYLSPTSYAINEDWKLTFEDPTTSSEAIFFIQWDATNDGTPAFATHIARSGNPTFKMHNDLWDELCSRNDGDLEMPQIMDYRYFYMTDVMYLLYSKSQDYIGESSYDQLSLNMYFAKYSYWDENRDNGDDNPTGGYEPASELTDYFDLPIYRYTDIDLLRAEALNKLGRDEEAAEIINDLRERTGYIYQNSFGETLNEVDAVNDPEQQGSYLQDIILKERQFELYGEGKRWYDLIRTGTVGTIMDPILASRGISTGYTSTPARILFPISSSAFESNSLLEQNDTYTK